MAALAIKEIKAQLQQQGGSGQVWVDRWKERFPQLGGLREFLESRSDVMIIPKGRNGFVVALVGVAAAPKGKGNATSKAGAGQPALASGGSIPKGKSKGSSSKGGANEGKDSGNAIAAWSPAAGVGAGKAKGNSSKGGWGSGGANESKASGTVIAAWVPAASAGVGKGKGSSSKGDRSSGAVSGKASLVIDVIQEIKSQLQEQGGSGKVWFANWKAIYMDQLGSFREFLERRPSMFEVHPGAGKNFTVALVGHGGSAPCAPWKKDPDKAVSQSHGEGGAGKSAGKAAGKTSGGKAEGKIAGKAAGKATGNAIKASTMVGNPLIAEAIREIKAQLQEQGGTGNVRVANWKVRFADLAPSVKEFLESRSDKFTLSYDTVNPKKFTVTIAGAIPAVGQKRKLPWDKKSDNDAPPAGKKAKTVNNREGTPLVDRGIDHVKELAEKEITKQLLKESNTEGRVWMNNWNSKFKDKLGTLREFLENSDKFVVTPTEGSKFAVSLLL